MLNPKLPYLIAVIITVQLIVSVGNGLGEEKASKPDFNMGIGLGYGNVKKLNFPGKPSGNGLNAKGFLGLGINNWLSLQLKYEIHRINNEQPKTSDIIFIDETPESNVQVREPEVLKTTYLLISPEIHIHKGFYLSTDLGLVFHYEAGYEATEIEGQLSTTKAYIKKGDFGIAYGFTVGYEFNISQHIALAVESVVRSGKTFDDQLTRITLGIGIVACYFF